jgi:hypothetical protein
MRGAIRKTNSRSDEGYQHRTVRHRANSETLVHTITVTVRVCRRGRDWNRWRERRWLRLSHNLSVGVGAQDTSGTWLCVVAHMRNVETQHTLHVDDELVRHNVDAVNESSLNVGQRCNHLLRRRENGHLPVSVLAV